MATIHNLHLLSKTCLVAITASAMLISPAAACAQKAPAITGIAHAAFYADDLTPSRDFYVSLLGWKSVPAVGKEQGPRFYANHEQYVELIAPPVKGQPDRLDHVAFRTNDAEALRKFVAAKGVAVPASVHVGQDGSRSFMVHDPEGNRVEFTQPGSHTEPAPSQAALAQRLSTHIMHAGYVVHDRNALDHFYKDILGFHLYWQGGAAASDVDWVMMQVPDGTDWIEYMLNLPAKPSRNALGSANHIAPGVSSVAELQRHLESKGWHAPAGKNPQILGVDGKLQLDLHDPDGTRIEFMEFKPVAPPCCSAYTGKQPVNSPGW